MAFLGQSKLEQLPQHVQRTLAEYTSHELLQLRDALTYPSLERLSRSREARDEIHRLNTVAQPVLSSPTTKRALQSHDPDSPNSIMRMRISKLNDIQSQCQLDHECRATLTCTSLLGNGNNWFDPGSDYRKAISKSKIRSLRLNIIFYPTNAQNNDPFFSPAAKLRQIFGVFRTFDSAPLIRVYVAFIQSKDLGGYTYRKDAFQFPTTNQRMVREALVETRKMIEEEHINIGLESNGDILLEGKNSITLQNDSLESGRYPPPYSQF